MLSTLKVADLVTELGNVVSGQHDLATALNQLRQDGSFRVIGDLPVLPFLQLLGIGGQQDGVVNGAVNEVPVSPTGN